MDRCFFAKEPPAIEVRGGLVFIQPKDGHCEIALAPSTLRQFIASANEALAKWQADQLDRIAEFPRAAH